MVLEKKNSSQRKQGGMFRLLESMVEVVVVVVAVIMVVVVVVVIVAILPRLSFSSLCGLHQPFFCVASSVKRLHVLIFSHPVFHFSQSACKEERKGYRKATAV